MKKLSLVVTLFFALTACVSAPRYVPQTMFPHGPVVMTPKINQEFSTHLHKFVELEFFNDNKEWVEIDGFSLTASDEKPSEIVTDQESISQWVQARADEKVAQAGSGTATASFGFALLGIGVAIAEIASGADDNAASFSAFALSDTLATTSVEEEIDTTNRVNRALRNAPLSSTISLPPGRSVTRWFVINTPEDALPNSFYINYTARGRISGAEEPKQIELINNEPVGHGPLAFGPKHL